MPKKMMPTSEDFAANRPAKLQAGHAPGWLSPARSGFLGRNWTDRFKLTLAVTGVILVAAILRIYHLDRTALWNDEAASWFMASHPFRTMIQEAMADNNPPIFDIILYGTIRLLGDSETALRLPSAILGVVGVYLTYRIGTVLWDRLIGLLAAGLLAISGFHLWYSQEARMYALYCAAASAFALTTIQYCTMPTRRHAMLCGVAGVILLYSHTYGILDWIVINGVVAAALSARARWSVGDRRAWAVAQILAGLSFVPWGIVIFRQAKHVMQDFWISYPTPHFLYLTARSVAGGTPMLASLAVLVGLAFTTAKAPDEDGPGIRPLLGRVRAKLDWKDAMLLGWAFGPVLLEYAVSLLARPVLFDRYLIASLPPILLLAARGLSTLRSNRPVLAGAALILILCSAPGAYKDVESRSREDFRSAVAVFSAGFRNSDTVVFGSPGTRNAVHYYFRKPIAHETALGSPAPDTVDLAPAVRVWTFVRTDLPPTPAITHLSSEFRKTREFHFDRVSLSLYISSGNQGAGLR